ncbi:MAG: hypothetical protein MJ114_00005, partial [Acetatifactor sp.]|nr:hypothetical protein [Acetatifactor sp.]
MKNKSINVLLAGMVGMSLLLTACGDGDSGVGKVTAIPVNIEKPAESSEESKVEESIEVSKEIGYGITSPTTMDQQQKDEVTELLKEVYQ